jgi:hypothetical protein
MMIMQDDNCPNSEDDAAIESEPELLTPSHKDLPSPSLGEENFFKGMDEYEKIFDWRASAIS